MSVADLLNGMPFADHLGLEVVEAADGRAVVELPMYGELSSVPGRQIAHGGVTYALADTAAGAAVISLTQDVSPTIDMRIDYLAPAKTDLHASAEVIRQGSSVAMVRVEIEDADGTRVATAQGTYKTGGQGGENPWESKNGNGSSPPSQD